MTPRALSALMFMDRKLRAEENIFNLTFQRLAAHGDVKDIKKQIDEWERKL